MYETRMSQEFTLVSRSDAMCIKCIALYGSLQLSLQFCYVATFCVAPQVHIFCASDLSHVNVEHLINPKMYLPLRNSNKFRGVHQESQLSLFLLIYFQLDATSHILFISGKLLYMFRVLSPPIFRSAHKTVFTVSGTCQTVTATCRYCGRVGTDLSVVWELY